MKQSTHVNFNGGLNSRGQFSPCKYYIGGSRIGIRGLNLPDLEKVSKNVTKHH